MKAHAPPAGGKLPVEFRANLPNARVARARHDSEAVVVNVPARILEFRMIEDVEELDANVERVVLVDCSPFQYAEIGVAEAGTVEKAPVGRPESSASGARKPGRIESAGVRGERGWQEVAARS